MFRALDGVSKPAGAVESRANILKASIMTKDELVEFLKERLSIDVSFYESRETYNSYTNVKVQLLLDGNVISEAEDYISK